MKVSLSDALQTVARKVGGKGRTMFEDYFLNTVLCGRQSISASDTHDVLKETDDPRTVQTEIDRMCQAGFCDLLKKFPGLRVVTEESLAYAVHGTGFENYTVVIDDWDGSTNGSKGLNLSAISIGLDYNGKPFMGCWYDPYRDYEIFTMEIKEGSFNCFLSAPKEGSSLLSTPLRARTLSQSRLVIHRGTKLHSVSDLHSHPLSTLGARTLAVMNYEASVIPLMHVALGMIDGFVVAGNKPWDLWGARAIYGALGIPFAFMEPFTYRVLSPEEIVPDPEREYAFACANNQNLMDEIMAVLQSTH